MHELDSSREIVAHCRSGKRSAEASEFLRKAGFRKIWNLKGRHPGLVGRGRPKRAQVLTTAELYQVPDCSNRLALSGEELGWQPPRLRVRNDGSIKVEGDFEIFDQEGKAFGLGGRTSIALCRCGHSESKPFCDGAHKKFNFQS